MRRWLSVNEHRDGRHRAEALYVADVDALYAALLRQVLSYLLC
jgi:hypothetical protein